MSCFLDLQTFFFFFPPSSFSGLSPVASYLSTNVMPKTGHKILTEVMSVLSRGERIASPVPPKMFVLYVNLWSFSFYCWCIFVFWHIIVPDYFLHNFWQANNFSILYRWGFLLKCVLPLSLFKKTERNPVCGFPPPDLSKPFWFICW